MSEMVTLTLTGAKRFTIAGTTHTVEKWQQCRVDRRTAEHLLDQYTVDRNNQEQPYFEEGVVEMPIPRADRKRVRASQRRLEREAAKADASMQSLRGDDAPAAQDPYKRSGAGEDPSWAVNTDVRIGPAAEGADAEGPVVEAVRADKPEVQMEVVKAPKAPRKKRASKKKARARKAA